MNIKFISLMISFFWIASFTFAQTNQKRTALVIGNGDYQNEVKLDNPLNDATDIVAELKKLGFDVMVYTDVTLNDMKLHMREFGDKLAINKGIGLFYYSGHGLQMDGENYLIPVEAKINNEQDVELESVNLKRIIGELEYAKNDSNIVILDVSRNNPFAKSVRGQNGMLNILASEGCLISFSTAPGAIATEGSGSNGLYTQELIKALRIPGLTITEIFKEVRKNVYSLSNQKQVPFENSSIKGDFYLNK